LNLERVLSGYWFIRAVLVVWIISAVSIFVLLKDIELIVHGQLYYYGLSFSPDWADPYRIYTWLIYLCLGLPIALSGVALVSSFIKEPNKVPEKKVTVEQRVRPQPVAKAGSQPNVNEEPKIVDNSNDAGISCPQCKKTFSRALVMLDFHSGKPKLVSVCPYCNYVLRNTKDEKGVNDDIHVANADEKLIH
jgi:uncharacterized Zn-finger protein